jgi:hypothetical protein
VANLGVGNNTLAERLGPYTSSRPAINNTTAPQPAAKVKRLFRVYSSVDEMKIIIICGRPKTANNAGKDIIVVRKSQLKSSEVIHRVRFGIMCEENSTPAPYVCAAIAVRSALSQRGFWYRISCNDTAGKAILLYGESSALEGLISRTEPHRAPPHCGMHGSALIVACILTNTMHCYYNDSTDTSQRTGEPVHGS